MTGMLTSAIVLIIIVGVVLYIINLLLAMVPMNAQLKQIAWVLIILVAIIIVAQKVLPILGIHMPF